jgi:hypothetical protein
MSDAGVFRTKSGHGLALGNERGATMVLVGLAVAGLLGMVALAVDVGMLFTARSEAQRAADSSALAGAGSLIESPPEVVGADVAEERAKDVAIEYAAQNNVRERAAEVRREDVEVDLANDRVTVTVRRIGDRGNPVGTWFARVFGIEDVDVAARATAEVQLASAGTCMKPFTIPDAWNDLDEDGEYDPDEPYDPALHGYGSDWRNGVPSDNGIDPAGTTYEYDFGRPLEIKEGDPNESIVSSWYFPWDVPQANNPDVGADRYRWNIANCNTSVVEIGKAYWPENGRMKGPTVQGTQALKAKDPDAYFDIEADSVVGSVYKPWKASPRVMNIPLFDPTQPVKPGKRPLVFNNITAFWLEGLQGDDVIGRFLYASGIGLPGEGNSGDDFGHQAKLVRLVE